MKEVWGIIRRARPRQLLELVFLCLSHPRLVWPTYRATERTIEYANTHFGASHRRNTPANAFRHALWNWLIAMECSRSVKKREKVLSWTEKITAMHEKILPGNDLSNAMDLHNNAVGRSVYKREKLPDTASGVSLFLNLAGTSRLVGSLEDIERVPVTQFVHLIEPET